MQIVKTLSSHVCVKSIGLIKSTEGMKPALAKRVYVQKMQKTLGSHRIQIFTSRRAARNLESITRSWQASSPSQQ